MCACSVIFPVAPIPVAHAPGRPAGRNVGLDGDALTVVLRAATAVPRPTLVWMALRVGIVVGLVDPLIQPLVDQLTDTKADYSGYGPLLGNLPAAMTLVAGAWLSAAVGEELVFRAFLMHQLLALFALVPGRMYFVSLTGGLVFGLMHANQGLSGIVVTGLVGALFGFAYLRSGRNLWSLVLAHGLIDTWGVMTLYLGWY